MSTTKRRKKAAAPDFDLDFALINGVSKPVEEPPKKRRNKNKGIPQGAGDPGEINIEELARKFPVALTKELPAKETPLAVAEQRPLTVIGQGQDTIHNLIEDGNWEEAQTLMYKRMAQSVNSLLPYLESEIRNTSGKKGAFNMNSMITTVRDLLGDIQQAQDRGRLGELIVDKLLRPSFMDVGMIFIKEQDLLQARLRRDMSPEQMRTMQLWMDEAQQRFVDQIQNEFRKLHEQLKEFLER